MSNTKVCLLCLKRKDVKRFRLGESVCKVCMRGLERKN